MQDQHLLLEWNQTETDFPGELSLAAIFEAQVENNPNATAIEDEGRKWTYRQLNERANCLAHLLRQTGVEAESLVAICLPRSAEMIIATLGIVKAGGAYVPIDPAYPIERQLLMLRGVGTLITTGELATRFRDGLTRIIDIEDDRLTLGDHANPVPITGGNALAYVIYTSGSTGQPKASAVVQRGVSRLVLNTNYVAFRPDDIVAQVSNCCFDAATFEIWGALLNGARLVVIHRELTLSPQDFAKEIREKGITMMFLTTSLFNLMARETPGAFAGLRTLVFGGEAADARAVRAVLKNGRPGRLVNGYGPTETTTFAVCHEINSVADEASWIPIGKPISNTKVYILDPEMNLIPIGEIGELYIAGPGVARGYLNAPDLTAEKFVRNPFESEGYSVLYRTGDLARWLPDGTIQYLGRADDQVKIRGFRIELGEIENVIGQHSAIRETVVLAREDKPGEKRLVAYLVGYDSGGPDLPQIRQYFEERLPDYMIPTAFVVLDQFPLNANGKIDRRALPAPARNAPAACAESLPVSETERTIAKIWRDALEVAQVGVDENFFDVGGDSLNIARVHGEVRAIFGDNVSIATLFAYPTIRSLASHLTGQKSTDLPKHISERAERQKKAFAVRRKILK
ncbi:MAG TPA: non-ribosomal peptide synthetase [Chthoniobacterales bacterium]|nr:non-ribosomal peptide synthetase [Chthoniobacterales bacterium]